MLPSLLLPIKYSSIVLVVLFLALLYNIRNKHYDLKSIKILILPFVLYYFSVIICFFIDVFYGIIDFNFLLRNLVVLIVPLFVFTSDFNRGDINKILKKSSVIISILGLVLILIWSTGYVKYFNHQQFNQEEWNKSGVFQISNPQDSIFKFKIQNGGVSFRRITSLSGFSKGDTIVRELQVKVNDCKENVWVYFRNFNDSKSQGAWFNAKTGKIGHVQHGVIAKSVNLGNGYFKFILKDKPDENLTREWFHFSFVSNNKSKKWDNLNKKSNIIVELGDPKFYSSSGKNFLSNANLFSYKITDFSFVNDYAHGTYMAMVFAFAFLIFLSNNYITWIRYLFILVNIFVILSLASKAVIIGLLLLFPIFYFKTLIKHKFVSVITIISILVLSFGFKSYLVERFADMFQTVVLKSNESLGDLKSLSTNQRINIYKNYTNLIEDNYLIGNGFVNGNNTVKRIYNYNFNSHNQYVQSIFNSGIIGLLLLFLFCASPFLLFKGSFYLKSELMFFLLLILFNFLFESMLYRQWGLILVSFSYSVYFQFFKSKLRWYL